MRTWSRRDVLQGAIGALALGLAGAAGAGAAAPPTITVHKDPT